jgi:hypothetical protein
MKSRDNAMSKTSSTHATEANVGSIGTVTASRRATGGKKAKQTTSGSQGGTSPTTTLLTQERVAERARTLWLASGCMAGRDEQNWREAEAQLKTELESD